MKDDKQIHLAFSLWQTMVRLETMLWDHYDKEFLQMLLDSKEKEKQTGESKDFVF